MKILIVGIGRSGTTLTFRILRGNPKVRQAYLEHCILCRYENRKALTKAEKPFQGTVCEKINYTTDDLVRNVPPRGRFPISIDEYCKRWLDWFGDEARIVHVIRHPLDGIFSFISKRGRKMGLYKGHKIELVPKNVKLELIEKYLHVASKYPERIAALPNTLTINYENLITKPNMIQRIYKFCKLPDVPFAEKLRTTRVFGHVESGFNIKQPIDHILKIYNQIGEIKYK